MVNPLFADLAIVPDFVFVAGLRYSPCYLAVFLRSGLTTTRTAGGLDFVVKDGKRQGHAVPRSLWVKPGAKHPVWKTQSLTML